MQPGMPWDWVTFPEFLDSVERTPKAVNILPYVPVEPAADLGDGPRGGQGRRAADRRGARRDAPPARTRRWTPAPAAGRPSACCRPGRRAVQRDYDGTPMPTDVMHDETCRELAEVLAERNEGFIQMTLRAGRPNARDRRALRGAGRRITGRPVLYNVVAGRSTTGPHIHRGTLEWLEGCRERGHPRVRAGR